MAKLGLLLGAGVGYVLGARAGRERYDKIQEQAQRVWKDPRVQKKKQQAEGVAKEKGSQLQDKASQKAAEVRSDSDDPSSSTAATPADMPASVDEASASTPSASDRGGSNG